MASFSFDIPTNSIEPISRILQFLCQFYVFRKHVYIAANRPTTFQKYFRLFVHSLKEQNMFLVMRSIVYLFLAKKTQL